MHACDVSIIYAVHKVTYLILVVFRKKKYYREEYEPLLLCLRLPFHDLGSVET